MQHTEQTHNYCVKVPVMGLSRLNYLSEATHTVLNVIGQVLHSVFCAIIISYVVYRGSPTQTQGN